jgi:hypothetical protein
MPFGFFQEMFKGCAIKEKIGVGIRRINSSIPPRLFCRSWRISAGAIKKEGCKAYEACKKEGSENENSPGKWSFHKYIQEPGNEALVPVCKITTT